MAKGVGGGFADPGGITGYHAHIYYDPAKTRDVAAKLRDAISLHFDAGVGSWHDDPVGPHPTAMYQVAFPVAEFPRLVPWLMLNRNGLDVLVHPETGNAYDDHIVHALWLGNALPLRAEVLRRASARRQ